jgi:hypothetical protein
MRDTHEIVKWARKAADEMRADGQNGWPVTCDAAADTIERLERERDEAIVRAAEQEDRAETAERQLADALEALTPSAETKAAYIGEFTIAVERIVNEDLEPEDESDAAPDPYEHIMVPWTTIKEIMAAIRARAMLGAAPPHPAAISQAKEGEE